MQRTHPIGVVSRLTGLSPHVIRIWEKRYNVVLPSRSDGNHRLYSDTDVERLRLLYRVVQAGYNIGQIADLPEERLLSFLRANPGNGRRAEAAISTPPSRPMIEGCVDRFLQTIRALDRTAFQEELDGVCVRLGLNIVLDHLVGAILNRIGRLCRTGRLRIIHERMASESLRTFLGHTLDMYNAANPTSQGIAATPFRQHHELGALTAAAVAASEGWHLTYLGPNIPAEELAAAVRARAASLLILGIVFPPDDTLLHTELDRMIRLLDPSVFVVVGGPAAEKYHDSLSAPNVRLLDTWGDLRITLGEVHANRTHR